MTTTHIAFTCAETRRIFDMELIRQNVEKPKTFRQLHWPRQRTGVRVMQHVSELEVYQSGELTVIGFGGREILDQVSVSESHEAIVKLIREHSCRVLAIDLSRVRVIPSGMLGLLASVYRMGVELHLFNPSEDLRDAVFITNLSKIMQIHEIDV